MASGTYVALKEEALQGQSTPHDWVADDIDVLLVLDTYTFSAAHEFVSDVSASELSATDYARKDVSGRSVDVVGGVARFKASDIEWIGLGGVTNQTIGGAIFFKNTGADATSKLWVFIDTSDIDSQDLDTYLVFENGVVFTW